MNGLLSLLLALVFMVGTGCAALDEQAPALDTAATEAMQVGGCLRVVCHFPPLSDCRVRPARCQR